MNHQADKASLRRRFAALRNAIPPDERTAAEAAIRDKLFSLPAWKNAPLICGYASVRGEIDMAPVWQRAVAEGKAYALPVTVTDTREGRMVFRRTENFCPHALVPARFGIYEPDDTRPALSAKDYEGALILVPGLAFDDAGFRVGYGGGYYDRFLATLRAAGISVATVGAAFAVCRTSSLPHEPHDIPTDYVIDERSITDAYGIRTEPNRRRDV